MTAHDQSTPISKPKRDFVEKIVQNLIRDLYKLKSNEIYSREVEQPLGVVSFIEGDKSSGEFLPEGYDTTSYSLYPPEADRTIHFCRTMRDLVSYADILTLQYARFNIIEPDERKLLDRLILLTNLIEARGTHSQMGKAPEYKVESQISAHFPYISESAGAGPFVQVYRTARNILYHKEHKRLPPWGIAADTLEGVKLRDKKLDNLASELATCAEAGFIAAFCLELILPTAAKEDRPIESHKVLTMVRVVSEVEAIVSSYGLLDNHKKLRDIFAISTAREDIPRLLLELRNQEVLRQKEIFEIMLKPKK
jgi:hypothetical protein